MKTMPSLATGDAADDAALRALFDQHMVDVTAALREFEATPQVYQEMGVSKLEYVKSRLRDAGHRV